jgi:hypothetical protein
MTIILHNRMVKNKSTKRRTLNIFCQSHAIAYLFKTQQLPHLSLLVQLLTNKKSHRYTLLPLCILSLFTATNMNRRIKHEDYSYTKLKYKSNI